MSALREAAGAAAAVRCSPAAAIAEAVFELEHALDLDDPAWHQGDIHWWPLYRLELYRRLFLLLAGGASADNASRRLTPALRRVSPLPIDTGFSPVWLVSDGISFASLGDRQVERFCHPLAAACHTLGQPAAIIDRGSSKPRSGVEPMRWWAPWTQRAKIGGLLASRLWPDRRHDHLVSCVEAAGVRAGVQMPTLNPRRFDAMARAVQSLAERLERRLRRERAKAVFVVGYYDVAGYAYVLAAARAGIPAVDVQHGVAGRYNLAYAAWPVRAGGWRLLPRWFWTWTEADVDVVQQWAAPHGGAHRAICGGHPFLQDWREGRLALDPTMQQRFGGLLAASGQRRRVLVTLQPNLTHRDALAPLLSAMRHCPDTAWWLRLHPMALNDRPALLSLLQEQRIACFDIDTATAVPLPPLLAQAHVHATHSSSTIIEAEALGIGSVVWSEYGAELAEDAVARGAVRIALDGPSFQRHLQDFAKAQPPQARITGSTVQALRTILESGE
jgi:hypothetical protein